ncbi:ATP-binding protein [Acaryochloris marina]|uniref:histidine kinase n=1 Tax=Acaryochloris marina (strain MBIC 11017) TaxID=329726 RepID=B0C7Q0_ACAM1|nr:ATP-binding protein [Acaryochloris marina]ABW25310.1 two-component sensor histidine kinase [Acaryochloris marina MBIC11017]
MDFSTSSPKIQHFLVIEDELGKRTVPLIDSTCSLGRDPSNSIVIKSPSVSRQHALLMRVTKPDIDSHLFRLIDGNLQGKRSMNGLTVNGQKCTTHDLNHGDEVMFGQEVRARYYMTNNIADVHFLESCESDEVTGFLSNLHNPMQSQTPPSEVLAHSNEAAIVRLASFPELFTNPIIESNLNGKITYLNPAAVAQFPQLREMQTDHPIMAGVTTLIGQEDEKNFAREVEIGSQIFEQSVHYIAESDLIRTYIVDITKRKRMEAALKDSERRFKAIFNQTFQFSGLLNPDGILLEANQTALEFGGLHLDDVINTPLWETRWWSKSAETQSRLKNAVIEAAWGKFVRYEVDILGAEDKVATIDFSLKPVHDEVDNVVLLIFEGRDISDHKQVESDLQRAHSELEQRVQQRTVELKQSNEHLRSEIVERQRAEAALQSSVATNRALINAMPDWMFRFSADGIFVNYKDAPNTKLPLPSEAFLGKSLYDVFPKATAQPFMECIEKTLDRHEMQLFEYQFDAEGNSFVFEARFAVSAENEVMAVIRDITERKRAEDDIRNALNKERELNELKSRFVAMTSHEFRTPLATILSSAELLEHYGHKWDETRKLKHLSQIQQSVDHMTGLLNDVLLLGKAESGNLAFNPVPMQLTEFCTGLAEELQITTQTHEIVCRLQEQLTEVQMDEKLLRHIFTNLLSNAIKYSPQGGIINFDLVFESDEAILKVQDHGLGIPPSECSHVFNSFNRATNVGNISGTGLGLAIVKRSVDLHGGEITLTSQETVGTIFTVRLPIYK